MDRLNPGDIVRHFKRETAAPSGTDYLYRIIDIAIHSETGEEYIVYRQLYGEGRLFIRPKAMFMSEVDRTKYPDIRQKWRFERCDSLPLPIPS